MAEKPSTLPQWSTTGGTTTEPTAGQKAAGFAVGTKPPAKWVNWLLNNIYQWIQYLDAPVGTGAGAGFSATGGSTSGAGLAGTGGASSGVGVIGTGGASDGVGAKGIGTGVGTGVLGLGSGTPADYSNSQGNYAGVIGAGGGTNSPGGVFYPKGSGIGVIITADTGTGIEVSSVGGTAVYGASTNVYGVYGASTNSYGVYGLSSSSHGVVAQGDISSPACTALHVVPQDADASSPALGNYEVNTVSGLPSVYAGVGWVRLMTKAYASVAAETRTSVGKFATTFVIPANTLRVGSHVRAVGFWKCVGTSATAIEFVIRAVGAGGSPILGSVSSGSFNTNATSYHTLEYEFIVRTVGGSGTLIGANKSYTYLGPAGSGYDVLAQNGAGAGVDTTEAITIECEFLAGAGGTGCSLTLEALMVEISD